jgi:small nuclear ribonucleoprotein (snRNP)-like protein
MTMTAIQKFTSLLQNTVEQTTSVSIHLKSGTKFIGEPTEVDAMDGIVNITEFGNIHNVFISIEQIAAIKIIGVIE